MHYVNYSYPTLDRLLLHPASLYILRKTESLLASATLRLHPSNNPHPASAVPVIACHPQKPLASELERISEQTATT